MIRFLRFLVIANTQGSKTAAAAQENALERLLRQGGRGRLDANSEAKRVYQPRCMSVITGEQAPTNRGQLARCWLIEIGPGDVDKGKLAKVQGLVAEGKLAAVTTGAIKRLAAKDGAELKRLRGELVAEKERWRREMTGGHARHADIAAELAVGLRVLGLEDQVEHLREGMQVVAEVEREADPLVRVPKLFQDALGHFNHVADIDGGEPDAPGWALSLLGWKLRQFRNGEGDLEESWEAQGKPIAYIEDDVIYVLPEPTYDAIVRAAKREGKPFGMDMRTFVAALDHGEHLVDRDKPRRTKQKRYCSDKRQRFWALRRAWLLPGDRARSDPRPEHTLALEELIEAVNETMAQQVADGLAVVSQPPEDAGPAT